MLQLQHSVHQLLKGYSRGRKQDESEPDVVSV